MQLMCWDKAQKSANKSYCNLLLNLPALESYVHIAINVLDILLISCILTILT